MEKVNELIQKSESLIRWVDERIDGLSIPSDDRHRLAGACFDIAHEHQKAIVLLVANRLYGSAFALVRLIFEAYIRGLWLLRCAILTELERFKLDTLNKEFGQLITEIENLDGYDVGILSRLKKASWGAMNSFTHSGFFQVVRRITEDSIESNYEEGEILDALNVANSFGLLSAIEMALMAKNEALANEILEKIKQFDAMCT